jgi:hypothetical protein
MNQLVVPPPVTASCFGDGTGTACPCGNFGSAGRGCANAFSGAGARLTATGRAGILGDTFKLVADGVPNSPGLYFQAAGLLGGGNGVTFGDGLLCGGFGIARLGVAFAATNTSQLPNASLPTPVHVTGATQAGDLRHYQLWYRDGDLTFCTPLTNNLTNVVSVTWAN